VRRETVVVVGALVALGCAAGVLLVPSPTVASWLLLLGGAAVLAAVLAVLGT